MEITTISRETIKPSSPTLHHLKHRSLSLIDQSLISAPDVRVIFFYSSQGDAHRFQNSNTSNRLKRSLSEVLTEFYPLAGRLNGNRSIHCNDEGLEYVEARVKAPLTLDQLVTCPKAEELQRLLPYDVFNNETSFNGLSAVQVTVFDACGGMTIGVSFSHVVADASSTALFINKWASVARGGGTRFPSETFVAPFNFATLFPPRDIPLQMVDPDPDTQGGGKLADTQGGGKLATKRFIFPQSKINNLKAKLKHQDPTRVEALSALMLKCLVNVSASRSSKSIFPGIVLDFRKRMNPPSAMHYLGNMALLLMMNRIGPETSMNSIGVQVRQLIKEVDGDYVRSLQADNALLLFEKLMRLTELCTNKDVRSFALSSWCRFPFYEVDFGWGEPTWLAPVFLKSLDSIIFMDRKNGDGIEAWLTLEQDDMIQFESELGISPNWFN